MRISDWSSDVCSSDLGQQGIVDGSAHFRRQGVERLGPVEPDAADAIFDEGQNLDRKSVVSGKSVSVRVDLGGRRIIKKTHRHTNVTRMCHSVTTLYTR